MSVLVRSKRGESNFRKRRMRAADGTGQRASLAESATTAGGHAAHAPGRRRELGPVQDQALYSCQCGFVFKAAVSTSVGCPNCGGTQAW
jgi:hypothetical protein